MWRGRNSSMRLRNLLLTAVPPKHQLPYICKSLVSTATPCQRSRTFLRNAHVTAVRHSHKMESGEEAVRWRYPASDRMLGMIAQVKYGSWAGGQLLTFNSKEPLQAETFYQALGHLYNKVESLRMCFRYHGDRLWVAEMPNPRIDFQEVAWTDTKAFMQDFMSKPFNMADGPLWHSRLMQSPQDEPCSIPEVKEKYPYQCHLLTCFHHAMNDGVTWHMVENLLFEILEDILNGVPINGIQLGSLLSDEYITEEDNYFKNQLYKDPDSMKDIMKEVVVERTTLLAEAFGVPEVDKDETRMLPQLPIKKQVMDALESKSLSHGVTLNSTLTTVLNTALVELVREAGLVRDFYEVRSRHPVNLRRYHPDKRTNHLGYHSYPMSHEMITPYDVRHRFWQYAAKLDKEFSDKLKKNHPCKERVVSALLRHSSYTHDSYFSKKMPPKYDLCFSNVYKKSGSHYGIGNRVQITAKAVCTQITRCDFDFLTVILGFREQVQGQFFYSTGRMTDDTAQAYASKVLSFMNELARAP